MIHFPDDPDHFADPDLDADFPLGDGTAETAAVALCPYCHQAVELTLDPGSGAHQEYEEDCEVCCRPWLVRVDYAGDGSANVVLESLDD